MKEIRYFVSESVSLCHSFHFVRKYRIIINFLHEKYSGCYRPAQRAPLRFTSCPSLEEVTTISYLSWRSILCLKKLVVALLGRPSVDHVENRKPYYFPSVHRHRIVQIVNLTSAFGLRKSSRTFFVAECL